MTDDGRGGYLGGCKDALPVLARRAETLGLALDGAELQRFATYCGLLREVGAHTNLTAIKDPDGIMSRLFVDSLTILLALPPGVRDETMSVVDVGAGAGIPGLPLKIACASWNVALVESTGKKARFMQQVVDVLGLDGVTVVGKRAEDLGRGDLRDQADLCVSRAVAALPVLVELTAPFVRPGGLLVFPKSGDVEAEIAAARPAMRELRVALKSVIELPDDLGIGHDHVLVVIGKRAGTPAAYPRRVGLARSQPIGSPTEIARPRGRRARRV